ncbi:MAG TPA: hypothetical protein VLQ80_19450, partial [Candidatus Saccharimonadia bacterium]|nr:hypothetical protein [Candidatus Saccharimonadia bacterium]
RPTAQQLQELRERGYRGPSPSTEHQAHMVLSRLRARPSENEAVTSGKVAGTASSTLTSLLAFLAGSCR